MPLSRHRTVQAVAGTLRRGSLIPDGSRVVVGLSGGADSVALAAILGELSGLLPRGGRGRFRTARRAGSPARRTRQGRFDLVLAHLNHGLRPSAARDEKFVAALARQWELPLVTGRVKVRAVARRRRQGIEEAARSARYQFLERVARRRGATIVAVGHHRDDQAETVLMNVLRGAGVRGLAGMPLRRPISPSSPVTLVRPLLEVGRQELRDYLEARRLAWVEDETNRSSAMLRNRLRLELLPLLERDYAPGLGRRLVQMAEQMRAVEELLGGRAAAVWDEAVASSGRGSVELRLDVLRREGRAVALELLLAALERLGSGRGEVTSALLSKAWQVIAGRAGGQTMELPGGARLVRRGDRVRLTAGR